VPIMALTEIQTAEAKIEPVRNLAQAVWEAQAPQGMDMPEAYGLEWYMVPVGGVINLGYRTNSWGKQEPAFTINPFYPNHPSLPTTGRMDVAARFKLGSDPAEDQFDIGIGNFRDLRSPVPLRVPVENRMAARLALSITGVNTEQATVSTPFIANYGLFSSEDGMFTPYGDRGHEVIPTKGNIAFVNETLGKLMLVGTARRLPDAYIA